MTEPGEHGFELRGTLREVEGRGDLRYGIDLPAAPDAVWAALTEPARLDAWYGRVEGDLRVGGRYHAVLFPSGWEGDGHVLECERGRRIRMESGEPGEPVTLDDLDLLGSDDGTTRLRLHRTRPDTAMLAAYATGTQLHLENLAAYLAGNGPVDPEPFWAALLPRYESLAAEAGSPT